MADHAQGDGAQEGSPGEGLKFENTGPSPEQLEAGRKLFASPCEFFYAAQALEHLPQPRGHEIALAGRSNVGKSSLINAVTGRKALARVSHQPGRTRQLNFFECEAGPIVLVDMPGYGYAEAPKEIKRDWQGLMLDYLRGRPNLRRVFLLLDARVEVKISDLTVMELLDQSAVPFQVVLTKADFGEARAAQAQAGGGTGPGGETPGGTEPDYHHLQRGRAWHRGAARRYCRIR